MHARELQLQGLPPGVVQPPWKGASGKPRCVPQPRDSAGRSGRPAVSPSPTSRCALVCGRRELTTPTSEYTPMNPRRPFIGVYSDELHLSESMTPFIGVYSDESAGPQMRSLPAGVVYALEGRFGQALRSAAAQSGEEASNAHRPGGTSGGKAATAAARRCPPPSGDAPATEAARIPDCGRGGGRGRFIEVLMGSPA